MSRIESKFRELRERGKKALITFVTAGDPGLETTIKLMEEMVNSGADIIELGIPYSDPIAEGPVIQAANARAMKNHIKLADVMNTVLTARSRVSVPILFLLYYNCILQYGPERFFRDCKGCGVDGVIIPDLPYEEKGEIASDADAFGIDIITLVSPATRSRTEKIARGARGFLYCVSSLGVTGMRDSFDTNFEEFFSYINRATDIPKAIGFGISTPEHVKRLRGYADGLIVGSAIVRLVGSSGGPEEAVASVGEYVGSLRRALDER